jgi:ribonuclease-3
MKIEKELIEKIGYGFTNENLLVEALTHRSYSNEKKLNRNYERLEFLGDAVLQLIVTEYLILKYKDFDEGVLSKYRGYFVSEEFLSKIAKEINLGKYIRLGKGEKQSGGEYKPSLLCDIFESLIAAIYLDGSYSDAKKLVINLMSGYIDEIIKNESLLDSKTELQKISQQKFDTLPEYKVIEEKGPEHEKVFFVEVTVGDSLKVIGSGRSKKKAEQDSAKKALKFLLNEE